MFGWSVVQAARLHRRPACIRRPACKRRRRIDKIMAYDNNAMLSLVTAGEKASGRSRAVLAGLLKSLNGNVFGTTDPRLTVPIKAMAVQVEMDKLEVVDAKAFKDALSYVIGEVPGTCYTGVVS